MPDLEVRNREGMKIKLNKKYGMFMFKCFMNREGLKIKDIGEWGQDWTDFLSLFRFLYEKKTLA